MLRLPTRSQWRPNVAGPILVSAKSWVIRIRRDLTDWTYPERTVIRHAGRQLIRRQYRIARPRSEEVRIQDTIRFLVAEDTTVESHSATESPEDRTRARHIGEGVLIWRLGRAGCGNAARSGGGECRDGRR